MRWNSPNYKQGDRKTVQDVIFFNQKSEKMEGYRFKKNLVEDRNVKLNCF